MKYLEIDVLDEINAALSLLDMGDSHIMGRVEAYSCKPAGDDKKLYKNLENKFSEDFEDFGEQLAIVSPFGPLTQQASRKTLYYLIATLNASFPDYDFSNVKPEQFSKNANASMVLNSINMSLSNAGPLAAELAQKMWPAIEQQIQISQCDIYSFTPDLDSDPAGEDEGSLWSLYYFFYNKKMKRILFFTCRAVSLLRSHGLRHRDDASHDVSNAASDGEDDMDIQTGWVRFDDIEQFRP